MEVVCGLCVCNEECVYDILGEILFCEVNGSGENQIIGLVLHIHGMGGKLKS